MLSRSQYRGMESSTQYHDILSGRWYHDKPSGIIVFHQSFSDTISRALTPKFLKKDKTKSIKMDVRHHTSQ